MRCQRVIQAGEHQPGLGFGPAFFRVDFQYALHVARMVNDQTGTDGLAGETGASTPGHHRHLVATGNFYGGDYIVYITGDDHPGGYNAIARGIGAVELAGQGVKFDVPANRFL